MRRWDVAMIVCLGVLGWPELGEGHDAPSTADVRIAAGSKVDAEHGWVHRWQETIVGFVGSHWEVGGMGMAVCLAVVLGYRAMCRGYGIHGKVRSMRALGRYASTKGRTSFAVNPQSQPVAYRPKASWSREERYEMAYRLASKGWSLRDIARELGISQREVELVVKL